MREVWLEGKLVGTGVTLERDRDGDSETARADGDSIPSGGGTDWFCFAIVGK